MLGEGLWEQVINWDPALKTLLGQGEMGSHRSGHKCLLA